jgi:hypothetical protein
MGLVLCFRGFAFYSISPYAAESRHGSFVLTVGFLCSIGRYAEESRHGSFFCLRAEGLFSRSISNFLGGM